MRRDVIPAVLVLACSTAVGAVGYGAGAGVAPSAGRATSVQRSSLGGGVSVTVPKGWHLKPPPVTGLAFPVDRLLLTSYPAARGGDCGPDRAERALPADGALIYLMEYRPRLGPVWAGMRRSAFPPRPAHFALPRREPALAECWKVPTYGIRFRDADRPFQLHVALGPHAGAARRAEVLRVLDSLRFTPLPAPPPDPYAGWHALHLETGDTLRTPPGWLAAANPSPRRRARPRTLFLAANEALAGLPRRRPSGVHALPTRFPSRTLATLPADGVLLWIRENRPGPGNAAWPHLPSATTWPRAGDFAPLTDGIARHWPRLRWLRAAAERRTARFSLWIVSGPRATAADRRRAIKAAASFAFSVGSFRNRPCRRACQSGTPVRVIAPARPRTRVALPGSIVDVTSAAGRVWALTCTAACDCVATHSSGKLVSIEARTGRVLSVASVTRPNSLAAGPSGVWTVDFWGGGATRYDPTTGRELARVRLTLPRPVAPGDRRFLPSYVAVGAERVWVSTARGYVVGIDPRSNAIAETLRVAPDASGPLLALGRGVWIGGGTGVRRFDPASGLSRRFAIRDQRRRELAVADLSFASGAVWATGEWATTSDRRGHREHTLTGDRAAVELDPATGTVRSIVTLPRGAYVKARGADALWMAVPGAAHLLRFDTDSRRLASTARVTSTGPSSRSPGRDLWTAAGPRSHSLVRLRALR